MDFLKGSNLTFLPFISSMRSNLESIAKLRLPTMSDLCRRDIQLDEKATINILHMLQTSIYKYKPKPSFKPELSPLLACSSLVLKRVEAA